MRLPIRHNLYDGYIGVNQSLGSGGTNAGAQFLFSGAFDNIYYANSGTVGNLYVVGNTGSRNRGTLYRVPFLAGVMGAPVGYRSIKTSPPRRRRSRSSATTEPATASPAARQPPRALTTYSSVFTTQTKAAAVPAAATVASWHSMSVQAPLSSRRLWVSFKAIGSTAS